MLKSKIISLLCLTFSVFFIVFIYKTTDDISKVEQQLASSPNVLDVTDLIKTKLYVTKETIPGSDWAQPKFDDSSWANVKVPNHRLVEMKEYGNGSTAYYRILIPKDVVLRLSHLKNEQFISFQYVLFGHLDIYLNGKFYRSSTPKNLIESILNVPLEDGQDNVIGIKGLIENNLTGIDHRGKIYIGKGAELNEMYRKSYKAMYVYPLIFILCKGSILFVFTLIFLLLKVHSSFEKFLMFGLFAVLEEMIAGDYLYKIFSLRQLLYLFCFSNVGAISFVYLFFEDLLQVPTSKKINQALLLALVITLGLMATDALFTSYYFSITYIMKAVTIIMAGTLAYFLPSMYRKDKVLFTVISLYIAMALWSSLFSWNVGFNLKAYGNLSLFFVVAYQTFVLFRREQELLQVQERQLREQERDVAIGRSAAFLAHDVRKPLELTKILVDKMTSGEANKELLQIARDDIESSIISVSGHINEIINYTKDPKANLIVTSFNRILESSTKQVMRSQYNVDVKFEYDLKAKVKVLADPPKLQSALINLIQNAVEAINVIGGRNSGIVKFTTLHDGNKFTFKIFNDGPPIPSASLPMIFKPRFTEGKSGGTGLGLASVQKIASEHQGVIRADNVPGGVEFTLELLASHEEDVPLQNYNQEKSPPKPVSNTHDIRVFIISKNENVLSQISKINAFNFTLEKTSDLGLAKELISKKRYDLYVLDSECFDMDVLDNFKKSYLGFLKNEVLYIAKDELPGVHSIRNDISVSDLQIQIEQIYQNRPKVLFVEDSKLIRYAWQNFHGLHNITCCSSPEEALAISKSSGIDFEFYVLDYYFENSLLTGKDLADEIMKLRGGANVIIASDAEEDTGMLRRISKRDYDIRLY